MASAHTPSVQLDRELEWASDTDSTASDLSGPGRNFDNLLGFFGRKLERRVNGAPRSFYALPTPPRLSQASFATASDATADGIPGHGLVLGQALGWGGRHLERVATFLAVRTGHGPNGPMKEIIQELSAEFTNFCVSMECSRCLRSYFPTPPAPPPVYHLHVLCRWLVELMSFTAACPHCGALTRWHRQSGEYAIKTKVLGRMVRLIRSGNPTSQHISLTVIAALSAMFPEFRSTFRDLNVDAILHDLLDRALDSFDVDPLLASSQRALAAISDVETFDLGAQLERMYTGPNVGRDFASVTARLVPLFRHPEKQIVALAVWNRIVTQYNLDLSAWVKDPNIVIWLWMRTAVSSDPVLSSLLTRLLLSAYSTDVWLMPSTWLDGLVTFIKCHPGFVAQLPAELQDHLRWLRAHFAQGAEDGMDYHGRSVDLWKRAVWRYDKDDPDAEPDDDRSLYRPVARMDGRVGERRIDDVWIEPPRPTAVRSDMNICLRGTGETASRARSSSLESDWRNCLWDPFEGWEAAEPTIPGWTFPVGETWHTYTPREWDRDLALVTRKRSNSV